MMRKIDEIIVHCTATRAGRAVSVKDVDAWHKERGFAGIGYHYLVELGGNVDAGRPVERAGAHCKGHNQRSIGVCYVGGLNQTGKPADTRTPQQKEALKKLIERLRAEYGKLKVSGHRDYANKACPCFDARSEYNEDSDREIVEKTVNL